MNAIAEFLREERVTFSTIPPPDAFVRWPLPVMNTPAQTEQISVTVQFGWGYSRSAGYGRPPLSAYLSAWTAMPLSHQTCVSTGSSVPLPAAPRTPHRVSSCSDVPVSEASPVSGSTRLFPLSDTHIPPVKWLPSPGVLVP